MIGRNKVVVVMSKDPKLHTKVHVKQQTCPLDQRLTFALVLRWRLWLCFPLCRHSASGNCVSSLGRTGGPGLLLRRGQRKKRTTRKRRRRCRRRWGQGGSWVPDSCSHCCCSHWHSRCYPRGQNHCCRLPLPHPHPVARRGSCSCQLCAVLVQPVKKCIHLVISPSSIFRISWRWKQGRLKRVVLTCGSCNMMGSLGTESLVLFFLFFRLVLGVVATLARFLLKAVVKVVEVADIPMVVVVVALGGSIGTSASEEGEG